MHFPQDVDKFQGTLLPGRYLQDPTVLDGKRVLLVGANKTACAPRPAWGPSRVRAASVSVRMYW